MVFFLFLLLYFSHFVEHTFSRFHRLILLIVYRKLQKFLSIFTATEAYDNDGLPHTLEHLVFMGSENYPYKGILDLLANRCLASGTNAATDIDNTYYTMETVGSEGFLQLLPIYLDHILFPTLTVNLT